MTLYSSDSKCPKLEHYTYKDAFTQENPMFRTNRKSNAIQDDKCYAEEVGIFKALRKSYGLKVCAPPDSYVRY